ncbi:MAG TPA: aminotransferase class I/II-fold pyridoxal phosphate-dependent enzyme [Pyrinomonadaceae bacterium]|jgi:methionine-gamma-lyase|nr:aminotransferase class I/II-fold pyridoxal phosphate-dependent enzyme [Pyrinomonadaceae bacterium]
MSRDDSEGAGVQTRAIHAGKGENRTHAVTPPIWQTTTFSADSSEHFAEIATATRPAEFYTRYGNPTHKEVEATIVSLEGGEAALLTSSGMGAIFTALLSTLRQGDHVVAQTSHYAGTTTLLAEVPQRFGVEVTLVDQTRPEAFAEAIRSNTRVIYAESPTNPLMQITDLRAVAEMARARGITTMVDNTFATPVNQRPLEFGIDVVVHSATKYLGGHSDVTAGCVVSSREFIERAWHFSLLAGSILSPFDGWLILRGLRTLGLRVERHNSNALALARFLEQHPKVERVYYPGLESHPQHALARAQMSGFTGMLSAELRGGYREAEHFIESLKLATYAASLGGHETLVVHPSAMWGGYMTPEERRARGLSDSLVRISVGLEDERDLVEDFERALGS